MNPKVERAIYIGIIFVLAIILVSFGKKQTELQASIPLTVEQLYKKLQNPKLNIQIIDVRPYEPSEEEEDDAEDYEFYTLTHIPGAIPLPDCDESKAPKEALDHINYYLPTVIVSKEGDPKIFEKCKKKFKISQNLAGGMQAWNDAGYPTEEDEYVPPKAGGGGCL